MSTMLNSLDRLIEQDLGSFGPEIVTTTLREFFWFPKEWNLSNISQKLDSLLAAALQFLSFHLMSFN